MKRKIVPLRKCIACGENKEKDNLIRVVRDKEKNVFVDISGKANGRGAYLCIKDDCFLRAEETNKLSRTLKVGVPKKIYEELKDVLSSKLQE